MGAHDLEDRVRHQVEEEVGRKITDDEWEWLKQHALEVNPPPQAPRTPPPGPRRSGPEMVGRALGWVLERLLLGGVLVLVAAGIAWAYQLDRFHETNDYGVLGWLGTSFLMGFLLLINAEDRWAWGIAGVITLLGLVAMAIGAIIRVA